MCDQLEDQDKQSPEFDKKGYWIRMAGRTFKAK